MKAAESGQPTLLNEVEALSKTSKTIEALDNTGGGYRTTATEVPENAGPITAPSINFSPTLSRIVQPASISDPVAPLYGPRIA